MGHGKVPQSGGWGEDHLGKGLFGRQARAGCFDVSRDTGASSAFGFWRGHQKVFNGLFKFEEF